MLELVERIATPTPRLIGVDPTGEHAGTPAVLMTEFPGRPQWAANQRWMSQLVEVLIDVHSIDAVAASRIRPFAVYAQGVVCVAEMGDQTGGVGTGDRDLSRPGPGSGPHVPPP